MWVLLGLLYLTNGIVFLIREIRFIARQRDMIIISYMRLLFSVTHGFIPSILCFLYAFDGIEIKLRTLVEVDYSDDGLFNLYLFWLFSIITYVILCLGYYKNIRIKRRKPKVYLDLTQLQISFVGFITLAVGFFSLYLWTKTDGSIWNFILKANWHRGDYDNSLQNAFAMFRQPAKMVTVSALIFFFQLINHREHRKIYALIGYILSSIASVLYLLCTDGRLQIVMFFGVQLIGFLLYSNKNNRITKGKLILIGIVGFFALILIARLDEITSFIRYGRIVESVKSESSVFNTIMSEFGYVYESGQTSIELTIIQNGKLFIIDDIVRGVFSILPSRFTPAGFESVWRYNTLICTGNPKAGTIPCDMIAQSVYDLHILGIFVIPLFWGQIVRKVETYYADRKTNSFNRAMYMGMVMQFFRLVNYCALTDFMRGLFAYLVVYIIAFVVSRAASLMQRG